MNIVSSKKPFFTEDEVRHINKKLNFLVNDWMKHLLRHVIQSAIASGVRHLFYNTPESLSVNAPVSNDSKVNFLYNTVPKSMGFIKRRADLRGRGKEELWYMPLNKVVLSASQSDLIPLEKIPPKYQGATIGILKHRGPYSKTELKKVLDMVSQSKPKKSQSAFWYKEQEWDGGQLFNPSITEKVFLQNLTKERVEEIMSDPVGMKFLHFIWSGYQHFSSSMTSFALVSPVTSYVWVINEIQTDSLNRYLNESAHYFSREDKEDSEETKGVSEEQLMDMLNTTGRSVWVDHIRENAQLKASLMENPNQINQLPVNTVVQNAGGVMAWINQNAGNVAQPMFNLARHRFFSLLKTGR